MGLRKAEYSIALTVLQLQISYVIIICYFHLCALSSIKSMSHYDIMNKLCNCRPKNAVSVATKFMSEPPVTEKREAPENKLSHEVSAESEIMDTNLQTGTGAQIPKNNANEFDSKIKAREDNVLESRSQQEALHSKTGSMQTSQKSHRENPGGFSEREQDQIQDCEMPQSRQGVTNDPQNVLRSNPSKGADSRVKENRYREDLSRREENLGQSEFQEGKENAVKNRREEKNEGQTGTNTLLNQMEGLNLSSKEITDPSGSVQKHRGKAHEASKEISNVHEVPKSGSQAESMQRTENSREQKEGSENIPLQNKHVKPMGPPPARPR